MPGRPDLGTVAFLADERIVLRNSAIVVETQCFSREGIVILCEIPVGGVAGCYIELAIGTESSARSGVIRRSGNIVDDRLRLGESRRTLTTVRVSAFGVFVANDLYLLAVRTVGVSEVDE